MIEIERMARKSKSIPLVSLIDVVFQLLIYFMLSTSFTRSESLELSLPTAAQVTQAAADRREDAQTLHIYISDTGETFLGQKSMNEQDMARELRALFAVSPSRGVLVQSAGKVTVQVLVHVMDRIYTAGGTTIAVADWVMPQAQPLPQPQASGREDRPNG